MRRTLAVCLLTIAAVATSAFAIGEARILGKVVDAATRQPITNAKVTVERLPSNTFRQVTGVKTDGTYVIFLLDGTGDYKLTCSAPGYQDYVEQTKLLLSPETNPRDIALTAAKAAAGSGNTTTVNPAVSAFNEGARLANAGDDAGAIKKLTEAVTVKPDLIAGWQALAKVQLRTKNYPAAIGSAKKALALAGDVTEMYQVLYDAYTATGDTANAAVARAKLSVPPASFFNEAVRLVNAGKDGEAEPLLRHAIAADGNFAQAYYELGMLYARAQRTADARTNLQKYLELAPDGKDATTATQFLNDLK